MHKDGETDIRGIYCALSVAKLTNVYTPEIFKESESWIAKCQTWEGGFGGSPGMEAHGGYGFCGLAALVLLGKPHFCCLKSFLVLNYYYNKYYIKKFYYLHIFIFRGG